MVYVLIYIFFGIFLAVYLHNIERISKAFECAGIEMIAIVLIMLMIAELIYLIM